MEARPAYIDETVRAVYKRDYDVIVAGGGVAGCAAALASARLGCKVLLVEKSVSLGGLATNGLIVLFNPSLCDRGGNKLIGGIAEEFMHASVRYGGSGIPPEWTYRKMKIEGTAVYRTDFQAPIFMAVLDELLCAAGVDILFDSVCCRAHMEDGSCRGVSVENKEGRVYYGCKQLVDATGDLDLFKRAGAPCLTYPNWNSFYTLAVRLEDVAHAAESGDLGNFIKGRGFASGMDGKNNPPGLRRYTVETGEEVSEFILRGREYFRKYLRAADNRRDRVVALPAQAQYRVTRILDTGYLLGPKDNGKHHEDSVGCAYTYKYGGVKVEVPYRTLVSKGFRNMITAGRSIASEYPENGLTRLIAPSSMTGEAAGTAAALALENKCDIGDVPVAALQETLVKAGGIIHFND